MPWWHSYLGRSFSLFCRTSTAFLFSLFSESAIKQENQRWILIDWDDGRYVACGLRVNGAFVRTYRVCALCGLVVLEQSRRRCLVFELDLQTCFAKCHQRNRALVMEDRFSGHREVQQVDVEDKGSVVHTLVRAFCVRCECDCGCVKTVWEAWKRVCGEEKKLEKKRTCPTSR